MTNLLATCRGFDWNAGNLDKNWDLHQVTNGECEEIFFNLPLIIAADTKHSQQESRFYALGQTDSQRWLFVAFTVRDNLIRVISARDMNQKEVKKYHERVKRDTHIRHRRR
jgi:uncharacterized protein